MDECKVISTILFDLDGTILDTRAYILAALTRSIDLSLGIKIFPDQDHQSDMLRRRPKEYFQQHYGNHASCLYQEYQRQYSSAGVLPFDGITETIGTLKQRGLNVGIVTNKALVRVEKDLANAKICKKIFDVIVTAEDTLERKPSPAPIQFAANTLKIDPGELVYVGDGPHDVIAAKEAGSHSVAVTWGYYDESELRNCSPQFLAENVRSLDVHLKSLASSSRCTNTV